MADERSYRSRRHWSEAEKRRMVEELERSGRPLAEVARRLDVTPSCLGRWRDQYRNELTAPPPAFVPVEVVVPPQEPAGDVPRAPERRVRIEIVVKGGRRLVVDDDIAPERLRRLVAAVETA